MFVLLSVRLIFPLQVSTFSLSSKTKEIFVISDIFPNNMISWVHFNFIVYCIKYILNFIVYSKILSS